MYDVLWWTVQITFPSCTNSKKKYWRWKNEYHFFTFFLNLLLFLFFKKFAKVQEQNVQPYPQHCQNHSAPPAVPFFIQFLCGLKLLLTQLQILTQQQLIIAMILHSWEHALPKTCSIFWAFWMFLIIFSLNIFRTFHKHLCNILRDCWLHYWMFWQW